MDVHRSQLGLNYVSSTFHVTCQVEELGSNASLVQILSERAEHELNLLLKQRSLSPPRVRQELLALAHRVTEGDLRHVKYSVRPEVQYWCARVHATQPETLADARQYLEQLHQAEPGADTRIVDALILETEEEIDEFFAEGAIGVAALQARAIAALKTNQASLENLVLNSLVYFERFCGPNIAGADHLDEGIGRLINAGLVAGVQRDEELARVIASTIVGMAHRVHSGSETVDILEALLSAGAAFQGEDAWAEWLERQITEIAIRLPAGEPSRTLFAHLQELKKVLKLNLGIHVRAEALTSAAN